MILYLILISAEAAFIKSAAFWTYLWQVKEYRLDRFWAEYGKFKTLVKFFLGSGGRKFRRPAWTKKAILVFVLSFILVQSFFLTAKLDSESLIYHLIGYSILYYFLSPFIITIVVFILKIPTYFFKKKAMKRAKMKIAGMPNLTTVGITGSYGKSSTKELTAQILSNKFKVVKTPENVNTEIGIAKFILRSLPLDTQIFVVEMGAYKIGEIKAICDMVQPKVGVLTGINEQHLALFGSLENTKKAKFELIGSLPADGFALFNGENTHILEMSKKWEGRGVIYRNPLFPIAKNIPKHYELNLQAAIDIAKYFGMEVREIDETIKKIDFSKMMIKSFSGKNGALVIDDTYSANPDGVMAALHYLQGQQKRFKILIMPCLIELGSAAQEVHKKIGKRISEVCDFAVITTKDNFSDIKSEAGDRAVQESGLKKISGILSDKLNSNAVILLEGRLPQAIVDYFKV